MMRPLIILLISILVMVPAFFALIVEDRVCKLLRVIEGVPSGLLASFEQELRSKIRSLRTRPTLLMFPSVRHEAYFVRSIRGDGVLLLSQGLVASSNEAALRQTLQFGIGKLRNARIRNVVSSMALWFSLELESWGIYALLGSGRAKPSTFGAVFFGVLLLPWMRTFRRLSEAARIRRDALDGEDVLFI